ncbi:hypothetical protein [Niabella aurantiaca]|uniref:hypothetical protein n=1 Tax=Niabella aurantiaca TaxID=379900 RepID=UPI000378A831|nr:hypothetical protein [Niabella aurantiaca]
MSSLKSLQLLLINDPEVLVDKPTPKPVTMLDLNEEHPLVEESDVYYLYPWRNKTEAAKGLKEWFDSVLIPEVITIKCTHIKKEVISVWFDMIRKYWRDDRYVRDRLFDLKTIKDYL